MEQKLLIKLREFGLNSYETKLWVALLSRGVSTAGELSDVANVPRSRSYDVLESLRKKGFVRVKHGKPLNYEAVPPEEVIKNTKKRIGESAKEQLKIIDGFRTKDLFKELERIYKQGSDVAEPNEFVGYLKNKANIKNQLQYMVENAKESVYITETVGGLNSNMGFLMKNLPVLEGRGVDVKVMVNVGTDDQRFGKIKIKNTKMLSRFYVVDGKEMLFMLSDNCDASILINTKSFIKSVVDLFNKQWTNSDFVS